MILSALLLSVALNLGLCFLFFTLFSIWRNLPINAPVYAPRKVAEGKIPERSDFNLRELLPSTIWVRNAWQPSEDELLAKSGLDAVVFLHIFVFSLRVFTFAGIVGLLILLPINFRGNQLDTNFYNLPNASLDSFSISNVDNGSNSLWVHFCAVYAFTIFVCYQLYLEYQHISSKRIECFYSSKHQPSQYTVLVRSVPKSYGESFSKSVESFFTELYPSEYLSHTMVYKTRKLKRLISQADALYRRPVHQKSTKPTPQALERAGILGVFGRRVDLSEHYGKKLEDLQDEVKRRQSLRTIKELPAAFVSFKSRFGAAVALHIQQGQNPTEWVAEEAPDPQDVHWPFFFGSETQKWIDNLVILLMYLLITALFFLPVVIVQGLTHLDRLETLFPSLKGILRNKFVTQVITGFLPSLILQMFLALMPPVMMILSTVQGYTASSQIEVSACRKLLWFTIWNVFFANALSGSALYRFDIFLLPKNVPSALAVAVPAQASFFIAYVVSSWTSTASELFRLVPLVCSFLERVVSPNTSDQFELPVMSYHSHIPKVLFSVLLGITYFFLAPLILPFLLVYYSLGYITFRHQLLNVYSPKFETGGRFWPIMHNTTIFSLILMHIIAAGIFAVKKLSMASSLTVPLPFITLVFNSYCRKRFLPIFSAYPAECLKKKDKDDEIDPMMADFHEKLVDAYEDPAYKTIIASQNTDSNRAPLLGATEA